MRKAILILVILLICTFTFAELKPLVSYSSNSVNSHACIPGNVNCAYLNSVLIDDSYIAGVTGTKIIGLSKDPSFPGTNAHVEIANILGGTGISSQSNYLDYNIYLTPGGVSKCTFTKDPSCGLGNCVFGISDETNAHLSKCNTFGANEIKLCCEFDVFIVDYPTGTNTGGCGINIFETKNVLVDENVNIKYSCDKLMDVNIMLFDSLGNPVLNEPYLNKCSSVKQIYSGYAFPK